MSQTTVLITGSTDGDLSLQAARRGAQCIDVGFGVPQALLHSGVSDLSTRIAVVKAKRCGAGPRKRRAR